MKLQITIEGSTFEELVENIGKASDEINSGRASSAKEALAPAAKAKRGPKAVELDPFAAEGAEKEEEAEEVTVEQVMKAGAEYVKEHGRDKAMKVLKKFGVKSARELKADQYADALEAFGG